MPNTSKIKFSQFVFNDCSNLSTIYINTHTPVVGEADLTELTELNNCIFRGTGITSVKLPKDVNISHKAFENCTKLKSIQVHPAQISNITVDSTAFYNVNLSCKAYMNQNLYETSIAFKRSSTEAIPREINSLYTGPLDGEKMKDMLEWYLSYYSVDATTIKHLVITEDVVMGDSENSESANILPNLETVDMSLFTGQLGANAFYNCTKLKTVIRGSNFTYVPAECFRNCRSLTGIIEANKYPKIWNEADLTDLSGELAIDTQGFEECISLETVKLPSTKIGFAGAFCYCTNLSTIYKDGSEKIGGVFDLTGISKLWVGWGHNLKNTDVYTVKLPRGVDIPEYCFYNCSYLKRIEFERIQTYPIGIGPYAFYGVNLNCKAYMDSMLAYNSSFQIKRNATDDIPKVAY